MPTPCFDFVKIYLDFSQIFPPNLITKNNTFFHEFTNFSSSKYIEINFSKYNKISDLNIFDSQFNILTKYQNMIIYYLERGGFTMIDKKFYYSVCAFM